MKKEKLSSQKAFCDDNFSFFFGACAYKEFTNVALLTLGPNSKNHLSLSN